MGSTPMGSARNSSTEQHSLVAKNRYSLGNPRKTYIYIFLFFFLFFCIFGIFGQILRFLVKITCFLSFSSKNHAESFINFVKNQILNPKRAKLDQKSEIGHVRTCQDLSRRTSTYCKPAEILLFFQNLHLSFFINKFNIFSIESCVFIKQLYQFL